MTRDLEFRRAVRAARASSRTAAHGAADASDLIDASVLDHLLHTVPREAWDEFCKWMPLGAGVHALWRAEQVLGDGLDGLGGSGGSTEAAINVDRADSGTRGGARELPSGAVLVRMRGVPGLVAAMNDPWDERELEALRKSLGSLPQLAAATRQLLSRWGDGESSLGHHPTPKSAIASTGMYPAEHSGAVGSTEARNEFRMNSRTYSPSADASPPELQAALQPVSAAAPSGPIVDFVDSAIRTAFSTGASDIHFECDRAGVSVKLRMDGVMTPYAHMAGVQRAEEVISRIKVMSQLDITERRTPQDGRLRMLLANGAGLDLRVSIMPSIFGEDAVMRLLDKARLRGGHGSVTLEQLGFDAGSAASLRELSQQPHGMLLVTGPTGSGKTTTLYAVLSEINNGQEKIITIEDPVEYELPGVLQIPVNERKGLTFEKGLRSILRHDPDRILVGEIRDAQTAEIAVQSALTGHQVYTTVHANSVFDVIGRFKHFGLDMFGFVSSLNGVVVQRLVRTLCVSCAGARGALSSEGDWLARHQESAREIGSRVGCNDCHGTGYRGRCVIAEVHTLDDTFRDLVTSGAPLTSLKAREDANRGESLEKQAARLVARKVTTIEEIRRVVGTLGMR